MAVVNAAALDAFVGKTIREICPLGYTDIDQNHCAHFVSHVFKLNDALGFGLTCASMTSKGKKHKDAGACLRVNEVYNHCDDLSVPAEQGCLIYITGLTNIDKKSQLMGTSHHKHIGIYVGGQVWNYSNSTDGAATKHGEAKQPGHVRKEALNDFKNRINQVYGGHTVARFTVIPDGAEFLTLAQIQDLAKPK